MYGLEWVTVRLPVLYRGGKRVRTREEELLREEELVLRALLLLYSVSSYGNLREVIRESRY